MLHYWVVLLLLTSFPLLANEKVDEIDKKLHHLHERLDHLRKKALNEETEAQQVLRSNTSQFSDDMEKEEKIEHKIEKVKKKIELLEQEKKSLEQDKGNGTEHTPTL